MQNEIERFNQLYEQRLKSRLEPGENGKFVVMDIESENYFLGQTAIEAYQKAVSHSKSQKLFCRKVGFPATHFVGFFLTDK